MGSFETLRDAQERLAADPSEPGTLASLEQLLATPERLAAARLLVSAHERAGNDAGLIRALEVLGDAAAQAAERIASLKRIAEIQRRKLRQPDLALATLVRGLELEPDDAALHRLAGEVAVEAGAVDVLVEVLGDLLESAEESARPVIQRHLSALQAGPIAGSSPPGPTPADLLAALQAFVTPGTDRVKALPELRRIAQHVDALDSIAEVVEGESEKIEDPAELAALLRFVALLREELKQPRQAAVTWNDLLAAQPQDREALEHLRALLGAAGEPKNAAEVTLRLAGLPGGDPFALRLEAADLFLAAQSPDSALRALDEALAAAPSAAPEALGQIQLRRGKLLEDRSPASAVEAYVQALRVRELEAAAAAGLERLIAVPAVRVAAGTALEPYLRQVGEPRRLAEALQAQVEGAAALPARRMRFVEIARLWERANEPRAAFAAQGRAFLLAPTHAQTRADLERLAAALDARDELLAVYEEAWEGAAESGQRDAGLLSAYAAACQAQGDFPRLAQLLEAQLSTQADPAERAATLRRLADLHEGSLDDPDLAFLAATRALRETPQDASLLRRCVALAEVTGAQEDLEALLEELARAQPPGAPKVELWRALARSLQERSQAAEAVRAWSEVRAQSPTDSEAAERLGLFLERSGRLEELADLVQQQAESATPAQRAAALARLAAAREKAGQLDEAVAALHRLYAATQGPDALRSLERILGKLGKHQERAEVLKRLAAATGGQAEKTDLLLRQARAQHQAGQPERAVATLAELLAKAPDEPLAIAELVALAADPGARPAALELLESAFKDPKQGFQRVSVLELLVESRSPEEGRALRTELAALHESLGDRRQAFAWRLRLVADHPADPWARVEVERLAAAAHLEEELEGAYEDLLEREPPVDLRLGATDRDLPILEGVLERTGRFDLLGDLLSGGLRAAKESGDEALELELSVRLARARHRAGKAGAEELSLLTSVLERREGLPGAIDALEEVMPAVGEGPELAAAEDLLLDAYRRAGDFPKLIPLLDASANRAPPGERRRALWLELAGLRLEQERAPDLAFLALARAYRESPADAALRERLIALAEAAEAEEELAALLGEVVEQLEPPAAAEVYLVMAGLCEGPLREPERAAELYRRAIERSPRSAPRAWPHLDRVLESLERWEELLPVLEARERAAAEGPERVDLLSRIAALAGERLDLPQRAVEAYRAVLERAPGQPGASRALEALYERLGQREPLLAILEERLAHAPAGEAPAIRLKLARLSSAADPARTEALCRQILSDDPLHPEAFSLLSALLENSGRHQELEHVLLARLAVTLAPEAVADLEYRLAELTYRDLKRPQPAAARYRAVLERVPRHQGALAALSEIYEASASWRELARVLGQLALAADEPALQRSAHVRHAEALVRLGDLQPALAAARQALDLDPDDEAELQRLRALLLSRGALPEAARALELIVALQLEAVRVDDAVDSLFELADVEARRGDPAAGAAALESVLAYQPANRKAYDQARDLYTSAGEWPALATLLGVFLPNLELEDRLAAIDALVEIHESKLGDASGAFGRAKEAVLLDPGSGPRRGRAERLARTLHRADELAATYREVLAEPGRDLGPTLGPLSLALAAIEDEDLDQVDHAEETLHGLLARDRGNAAAFGALARMFARRGLHQKLARALELQLESSAGAAGGAEVLRQLAELREAKLGDQAGAADALRRRFDLLNDVESARMLVAFHRRHGQWAEAVNAQLLVRDLAATPRDRAQAQLEVAGLYERELADPESALAAYLEALKHDPAAPEPFLALEHLYRQLDRPAELLRAYDARMAHADAGEQVELLFKAAMLWERAGDPERADGCLEAVLNLRPGEVRAMEGLARLRRAGARWQPLVEILTRHAGVADQPEVRAALCTELGEVNLSHLQDTKGAERWLRKALEHVPTHRPALRVLGELDQREGRWAHAAELLEREAKLEEDPAARAALLHGAGAMREERLGDLVGARKSYDLALEADDAHWPSARRLRALHAQAKAWPDYEASLAHEARRGPSAAERCAAAVELAAHLAQRSQDSGGAMDWYQHALDQQPGALEASLPLADLLVEAGQWARVVDVLEVAVARLGEGGAGAKEELVRRWCQLGLANRRLERPGAATECHGRALELDPEDPAALRGWFELLDEIGRHAEAAGALQRLLALHGEAMPAEEQVALGVRLGELCQSLGRAEQAQAATERALALAPGHPGALRLLVAACDQTSAFEKAVRYRQQLAAVAGPDERYQLLFELGAIAHQELSDPVRAIDGFLQALQVRPGSLEVLQRLHVAYRAAGQDRKAIETLQALLAHPDLPSGEWRRETLVLAELLGRLPSGMDSAAAVLQEAFDRDPGFADAIEALENLFGRARQWKRLDAAYERAVQSLAKKAGTAPAQASLWLAAGELRLRELKDRSGALVAFAARARLLPDDPDALETFGDLAMELPAHMREAMVAFLRAFPVTKHPEKVCSAAGQLAERSGDADSAYLAARAAQLLATPTAAQDAMLARLAPLVQAPPELRAPVSEESWRGNLLHPAARGPLGDLMATLFQWGGPEYGADLGDFKLHPKKHAVDLGTASHPALRHLAAVAGALGHPSPALLSPFLAPQPSGRRTPHPDDAAGLRVVPTVPLSLVVGERFLTGADPAAQSAWIGHALARLRPELAMAAVLGPERLALVLEAALSIGHEGHVSRLDPKVLKGERKRLEKAMSSAPRDALSNAVRAYQRVASPDDLARYFEGARLTSLRAALFLAGDFGPVRSLFVPAGHEGEAALRELVAFALGGDLQALRQQTQSRLIVRR